MATNYAVVEYCGPAKERQSRRSLCRSVDRNVVEYFDKPNGGSRILDLRKKKDRELLANALKDARTLHQEIQRRSTEYLVACNFIEELLK